MWTGVYSDLENAASSPEGRVIAKLHSTGQTGPDPTGQSPRTLSETRVPGFTNF